ncbi:fungal specific transcription factor domain-containing protein [Colletotrichum graminicola]|uniref:Fungal specific transcription factor domain-containing protein n=1 Tax=Colletotrichum graminicola (strain M1.001 / M2 / FGSC 10212) TaxID=645133 RepID=E3QY12_COLGM|nr:fungal specific transcription factor domain-containing protein [Colletotrichum graminicola M1.001]EFQ35750.1 fungal specific transcription factor domain-containing protein [Colletotrichum graminicola M1.001]WDK10305.1 fungal specific transcription factor domain-containing protein [Colletotrichum graminicola]
MASSIDNGSDQTTTPPATKRRRIALACTACRLRKTRCDGVRPSCASCVSLRFQCQYEPGDSVANVIVRKEYMSDLDSRVSDVDSRVSNVEQMVQRLNYVLEGHLSACAGDARYRPSEGLSTLQSLSASEQTKEGLPHAAGLEEPQDEDATTNGMAMTFIEEHTSAFFGGSSNINFTRLLLDAVNHIRSSARRAEVTGHPGHALNEKNLAKASRPYANPVAVSPPAAPKAMTTLPSAEEMDRMLDVYFNTGGKVFPFIHEESMRETYEDCKANGWTRVRRTFLGSLNVIFAMTSAWDRDAISSARERQEKSNVFLKRAKDLCGELSMQVISLENVQYLVLLVIHCQGVQRSTQAWNYHGVVVRSAMALGLHSAQARRGFDELQAEYGRRTWIVIYCMDKVLSVAFGRPAIIPDEYMVDQPSLSELVLPSPDGSLDGVDVPGDFLGVSFRLYQIMSGSLRQQYGGNIDNFEPEPDDMAPLQASGQFKKQLRLWSTSLPPYLRLCESKSKTLLDNSEVNRLRVILTLRYHNINILIHRPLLSNTIRHHFGGGQTSVGSPSYLIQLAMGEAHECIRSAQSTIEIVYAILTADQTGNNNLGVGYYTLYYVFTASLVILGRILWTQHGPGGVDETSLATCKTLLGQVQIILQKLDHDNSLVCSCSRYISNMLEVCTAQDATATIQNEGPDDPSTIIGPRFEHQPTSASAPNPLETMMHLGIGDMEMFHLYSSEVYDPRLFEGLDRLYPVGHGHGEEY